MSISAGFTSEEIREFVYEYERQPRGGRMAWREAQGVPDKQFRKWRNTVFDGDLERGLVPREGSSMTSPTNRRLSAKQRDVGVHAAEVEQLQARVRELEATNEALGKAIGLLHAMSEEEPADPPTSTDPSSS
jgi:hypothetical protein